MKCLALRSLRLRLLVFALAATLLPAFHAVAGPVPGNIGGGLEVLYKEYVAQSQIGQLNTKKAQAKAIADPAYEALRVQASEIRSASIQDKGGRVMVMIHLTGDLPLKNVVAGLEQHGKFEVTAQSDRYRNGVIEGWLSVPDAAPVARLKGVSTVILSLKPQTNVGLTTQMGVVQHRVNNISQDGTGITIGALSDSYNVSTNPIKAANDVASGDLPGPGNPLGNTMPVVVVQDFTSGTDEGRAMLQVIHDMAPKARLGFGTGNTGLLGFADNMRSLAGLPGAPNAVPGFNADVIVDDLIYFAEPMFEDGIVAQGVIDVTNAGRHYFSSAGNRPSSNAYNGTFNFVDPTNTAAITGSNINLTGVNPALYAGGFHNFRTDGSIDIAQNITRTAGSGTASNRIVFQWDDPFDLIVPGTLFNSQNGNHPGTGNLDFTIPLTAGTSYRVVVAAVPPSAFDAIVSILDPNGVVITGPIDTGTDETLFVNAALTGNYTVRVASFGSSTGPFTVDTYANSFPGVTTDYNLLFFDPTTGAFINSTALATNNFASNEALETATMPGFSSTRSTVAMVIARANTPSPANANRLRYVIFDSSTATIVPAEYISYQYSVTYGHNSVANGNGVAAYSGFRPFIPESYTSPGPVTIAFDSAGNRLPTAEVRQKPNIAAMDGANNTFFSSDSSADPDTFPNFFGTSCAAPNAAACAALVLQANGGPGSLGIDQMKSILQSTTFPHDLDPYFSTGSATPTTGGNVTITVNADTTGATTTASVLDLNIIKISYTGSSSIASLTIDLHNGSPTSGDYFSYQRGFGFPGMVWDNRTAASGGMPFTIASTTGTLTSGDVTPSFSEQAPAPSVVGAHFYKLTMNFNASSFSNGSSLTFVCDRDEQHTSANASPSRAGIGTTAGGNSADLWGKGVLIPTGQIVGNEVTFTGTLNDGGTFSGTVKNVVGSGWSPLDGWGFINAEAAVNAGPGARPAADAAPKANGRLGTR